MRAMALALFCQAAASATVMAMTRNAWWRIRGALAGVLQMQHCSYGGSSTVAFRA